MLTKRHPLSSHRSGLRTGGRNGGNRNESKKQQTKEQEIPMVARLHPSQSWLQALAALESLTITMGMKMTMRTIRKNPSVSTAKTAPRQTRRTASQPYLQWVLTHTVIPCLKVLAIWAWQTDNSWMTDVFIRLQDFKFRDKVPSPTPTLMPTRRLKMQGPG